MSEWKPDSGMSKDGGENRDWCELRVKTRRGVNSSSPGLLKGNLIGGILRNGENVHKHILEKGLICRIHTGNLTIQ